MKQQGEYLLWHGFVGGSGDGAEPGVVENYDGSLMKSYEFRGSDVTMCSPEERLQRCERVGALLKAGGRRWSWLIDSQNIDLTEQDDFELSEWPTAASELLDTERAFDLCAVGARFKLQHVLTLSQSAPSRLVSAVSTLLTEAQHEVERVKQREDFIRYANEFAKLLSGVVQVRELSKDETATYLKSTISTKRQRVRARDHEPLSESLGDEAFIRGLGVSKLGKNAITLCTLGGFPTDSYPQMLAGLSRLPFKFRATCRWRGMERAQAKQLMSLREEKALGRSEFVKDTLIKWFQARISSKAPPPPAGGYQRFDRDAVQMADQAGSAMTRLDARGFGHMTTTFIVWDRNTRRCLENQSQLTDLLRGLEFVVREERLEPFRLWTMSLPGNRDQGRRTFPVSSRNVADLLPTSSEWQGTPYDADLFKATGVKRSWIRTADPVTFNVNTDVPGGAAHALLLGAIGSGKSTLANHLSTQFLAWPDSQVISLSVGRSELGSVLLNDGTEYSIGANGSRQFQPLAYVDEPAEAVTAFEWLQTCLAANDVRVTPEHRQKLTEAVELRGKDDQKRRTMSALVADLSTRAPDLATGLRPYATGGAYGMIFDGDSAEALARKRWTMFDLSSLLGMMPAAVVPALAHLLHRITRWFDGRPTLLSCDECQEWLHHPQLSKFVSNVLDTKRKDRVRALMIAPTPDKFAKFPDLYGSIKTGCVTKIYGADAHSMSQLSVYQELGLNSVEVERLTKFPVGSFLLKNAGGSREFAMNMGPIALAMTGLSSKDDLALLADMRSRCSDGDEMLETFLAHKKLTKRAMELRAWRKQKQTSTKPLGAVRRMPEPSAGDVVLAGSLSRSPR